MLDHDGDPHLEVLLHLASALFEEVLHSFNFTLQVLQLVILGLVLLLVAGDLRLELILFLGPLDFSILVDHASQRVLFTDLLNLVS